MPRQSNDINIAFQFLKGSEGDGARDVNSIKVGVQWFKGMKIGTHEWLNGYRNDCLHEEISLSW